MNKLKNPIISHVKIKMQYGAHEDKNEHNLWVTNATAKQENKQYIESYLWICPPAEISVTKLVPLTQQASPLLQTDVSCYFLYHHNSYEYPLKFFQIWNVISLNFQTAAVAAREAKQPEQDSMKHKYLSIAYDQAYWLEDEANM